MEVQATFWHSNILEQNKLSARSDARLLRHTLLKYCLLSGFSIMQEGNFAKYLQVGKTAPSPGGNVFVMVRMDKHQPYTTSAHSQYMWIHMLNFLLLDFSSVQQKLANIRVK